MAKTFLSHSSKQKWYVNIVAEKLGEENVVLDEWTFEPGARTILEIIETMQVSDIFCLFISKEALESRWVMDEISQAQEMISEKRLALFYPIIIDESIKHDDSRIPSWVKENYNLRYISKPSKAVERIKNHRRILNLEYSPINRELDQLFVGRTELRKVYQDRIYDSSKTFPNVLVASGLPSIGRRKYLTHMLRDSAKIRVGYEPQSITMSNKSSVEDFINFLHDLGYSDIPKEEIKDLISKPINEKLKTCRKLLLEVKKQKEIVYVLDTYSIITDDGSFADWFWSLIQSLDNDGKLYLCIITRSRFRPVSIRFSDRIFSIDLPELSVGERKNLFNALLEIHEIELSEEEINNTIPLFNGFPDQIFFAVDVIRSEGYKYLFKNSNLLSEFNYDKVHALIFRMKDSFTDNLLAILSIFDFVSFSFLEKILIEDFQKGVDLIEKMATNCIIEYIGSDREYIRLNDIVRDYISRSHIKISPKSQERIKNYSKQLLTDYESVSEDISSWFIAIKELLKAGETIDDSILIPSHFLTAMKDLYYSEKPKHKQIIALADRVLDNEKFLDRRIAHEVRYYLCLSLARLRDSRLLKEVQEVQGIDHGYLLGFYYRYMSRYDDAIERLNQVIQEYGESFKVLRELVLSYLNLDLHSSAIDYARKVYNRDRSNAYNLQSYFRCLIKLEGHAAKQELKNLLDRFQRIKNERTEEMYLSSKAQYHAIVESDYVTALNYIDEAIKRYQNNHYPYLTKIEICRRFKDIDKLGQAIDQLEKKFANENEVISKIAYLSAKAILLCYRGKQEESLTFINSNIKNKFPNKIWKAVVDEVSSLSDGH